jgi:hypothetical protein
MNLITQIQSTAGFTFNVINAKYSIYLVGYT